MYNMKNASNVTEVDLKQILHLKNNLKLEPWQIAGVTGITPAQVNRICRAKKLQPKRERDSKTFDWKDFGNSVI
jgi:hypothetical protein